ncbi:MAG TPA: hypothetical protein VMM37_04180, partial [Bacteroidota bacterium]|nr:hypothetical protein [Bacteroidota bacterium]
MKKLACIAALLCFYASIAVAQTPQLDLLLTVQDNGGTSRELHFGIDPTASDSLDSALGEEELPPLPPASVFDARFIGDDIGIDLGEGSLRDYRSGDVSALSVRTYELRYQVGTGTTVTIAWHMPIGAVGLLQDVIVGTLVNVPMTGDGSYTVSNPNALPKLKMTVTYAFILPTIMVSHFGGIEFGDLRIGSASASQFYLISGKNLTNGIAVMAP